MDTFSFVKHARLMGRFDCQDPEAPVAAWVNSAVFLTFEGEEIWMRAEDSDGEDYLEIILDGVARNWIGLEKGVRDYRIETEVPEGVHTLEIQKRTELLMGRVTFLDFYLPKGGKFLEPPGAHELKLEYFGDSITNGCGNGHPHEVAHAPALDNGYMSYAALSARMLSAEYHTIAISGIGVLQDAMGNINGLPPHFHGVHGYGTPDWDFSRYIADGVIINLGQNDYSNPISDDLYVEKYIAFIEDILRQYPQAYVFCCVGTMNNNYLPSVERVTKHFRELGNEKVFPVDLGLIIPEVEGWGGGFHPGFQTHYRMAQDLADFISEKTGWPLRKRPVIATKC